MVRDAAEQVQALGISQAQIEELKAPAEPEETEAPVEEELTSHGGVRTG